MHRRQTKHRLQRVKTALNRVEWALSVHSEHALDAAMNVFLGAATAVAVGASAVLLVVAA